DGHTATGQVKGVDQSADLAIVKVSVSQDQLHPLAIGNSDTLQVGDTALAIGSPFGLHGTFTAGFVSGLNRSTPAPNGRALTGMIQTDAPINPGNSGGALIDGRGQLVGINDSIQSPVEGNVGVGFAIPVNRAESLLPSLEKGVAIQHPWLGISGETITSGTADQLGLGEKSGVLVVDVVGGGPAAKAGLQASGQADASDDIITAIDSHPITTIEQLTQYLDTKKVGDRVTLSVTRNGKHISVGVTLGNFQAQPSATPEGAFNDPHKVGGDGLMRQAPTLKPLPPLRRGFWLSRTRAWLACLCLVAVLLVGLIARATVFAQPAAVAIRTATADRGTVASVVSGTGS